MKALVIAAACLTLPVAAIAQDDPPIRDLGRGGSLEGPPAELLPDRIGGAVVYVHDLEMMRNWYETMLGFRAVNSYARDGLIFEYIMQAGDGGGAFMGLMRSSARPAGSNTNSRVVLPVPDPRALANFFSTKGVYVREAVPGSAYFILDPEGNQVELYRLSVPSPASAED